jgi:predicted ATPase
MGSRLVARVAEADALDRLRAEAASGSGAVVVITGEAGIGKTAVVEEFVARSSADGATVLTGRADPEEGAPAFWPWLRLFDGAPGTLPGLTPSLFDAGAGDGSAAARFRVMHAAVSALRTAAERHPGLILVLEDLHWADPASLSLLAMLGREVPSVPLLVVATTRPSHPEPSRPERPTAESPRPESPRPESPRPESPGRRRPGASVLAAAGAPARRGQPALHPGAGARGGRTRKVSPARL